MAETIKVVKLNDSAGFAVRVCTDGSPDHEHQIERRRWSEAIGDALAEARSRGLDEITIQVWK